MLSIDPDYIGAVCYSLDPDHAGVVCFVWTLITLEQSVIV